ncbi:MAG: DUF3794 domain-containing protein [Clostridiales bacterium]|nr:DUF3794 domain-containing protein [Clostridiales bacterium]
MALEYRKDLLRLDQVIGEAASQALMEGEISVPDDQKPIAKILDINGAAIISSHEVFQDRIMAEGIIRYNVLYIPEDDGQLDSLDAEIGFTQYLEFPGAAPKMTSRLHLSIEHIDYDLISGRKLGVKAVLNLTGQVTEVSEMEVITEFSNTEDVEMLPEHIRVSAVAGSGHARTMVREDLELADSMPTILKILRKDAKVRVREKKAADNRVQIHGDVEILILYLCEDQEEPIQFLSHSISFSHPVEIPGAYQGMDCRADVQVEEIYVDPRENINGELRILDTELILGINAQVLEFQEGEILTDAYSRSLAVDFNKMKIKLHQSLEEVQEQTALKESIHFPEGAAKVRKILYVDAVPNLLNERVQDGSVILEGIISARVVYQTNDPALLIGSFREDFPFSCSLNAQEARTGRSCKGEVITEQLNHTLISQEEAELKITLLCRAEIMKTVEKDVITGVEETEKKQGKEEGIYIYFVQPEDTLWSIAKKYNTTIAGIRELNDLDEEEPAPGTRLLIYKKLEMPAL